MKDNWQQEYLDFFKSKNITHKVISHKEIKIKIDDFLCSILMNKDNNLSIWIKLYEIENKYNQEKIQLHLHPELFRIKFQYNHLYLLILYRIIEQ